MLEMQIQVYVKTMTRNQTILRGRQMDESSYHFFVFIEYIDCVCSDRPSFVNLNKYCYANTEQWTRPSQGHRGITC